MDRVVISSSPEGLNGPSGIRASVVTFSRLQFCSMFLERVGDVLQEYQAKDDVLVFRRVHVVAKLIGGKPKFGLKSKVGGTTFGGVGFLFSDQTFQFRWICGVCESLNSPSDTLRTLRSVADRSAWTLQIHKPRDSNLDN